MTITLATNSDNDIYLGADGNIVVLTGIDAVAAACKTAAKAQLGEMVLALGQGIPNFEVVWKGTPNYQLFASYLRSTLQAVEGVKEVTNITMDSVDNILSYTADITTTFGRVTING